MKRLTSRNCDGKARATRVGYYDIIDKLAYYEDLEEQGRLKVIKENGRPKRYSDKQIVSALKLLKTHSYTQVANITGISKSTLIRANKKNTK